MLRRPRGEAAQKILESFEAVRARELSIHELLAHTELSPTTLAENVKLLERDGKVETYRDDGKLLWVRLS